MIFQMNSLIVDSSKKVDETQLRYLQMLQSRMINSEAYISTVWELEYNIFRDHLGTITEIRNSSNGTISEYAFDAWGRRRSADDWNNTLDANDVALFANRGFTGHEYLPEFKLFNMNGRLYDPVVGHFLSPDNFVNDPANTQSYNRYSYCLNNPLKYTDPNGQIPLVPLIGSWVGNYVIGGLDRWINKKMSFGDAFLNAPIVGGVNYSPSDNSLSNNQVDAQTTANGASALSDKLDGFIASQYGAAERSWNAANADANYAKLKELATAFSSVPGFGKAYFNGELPPNSGYRLYNGDYKSSKDKTSWGLSFQNDIYISPKTQQLGIARLFSTVGHELVHVINYNNGLDLNSSYGKSQTEHAAWSYTETLARSMGWSNIGDEAYRAHTYFPAYTPPTNDVQYEIFNLPYHR
jgi:RHS repeat-associated protein